MYCGALNFKSQAADENKIAIEREKLVWGNHVEKAFGGGSMALSRSRICLFLLDTFHVDLTTISKAN